MSDLSYSSISQRAFYGLLIPGNIIVKIGSVVKGNMGNTWVSQVHWIALLQDFSEILYLFISGTKKQYEAFLKMLISNFLTLETFF